MSPIVEVTYIEPEVDKPIKRVRLRKAETGKALVTIGRSNTWPHKLLIGTGYADADDVIEFCENALKLARQVKEELGT